MIFNFLEHDLHLHQIVLKVFKFHRKRYIHSKDVCLGFFACLCNILTIRNTISFERMHLFRWNLKTFNRIWCWSRSCSKKLKIIKTGGQIRECCLENKYFLGNSDQKFFSLKIHHLGSTWCPKSFVSIPCSEAEILPS